MPNQNNLPDQQPSDPSVDELSVTEWLGWAEFACWTMLVLAPILYYVNGPSVSPDQRVVRTVLVVLAALGAVALRFVNWRRRRNTSRSATGEAAEGPESRGLHR